MGISKTFLKFAYRHPGGKIKGGEKKTGEKLGVSSRGRRDWAGHVATDWGNLWNSWCRIGEKKGGNESHPRSAMRLKAFLPSKKKEKEDGKSTNCLKNERWGGRSWLFKGGSCRRGVALGRIKGKVKNQKNWGHAPGQIEKKNKKSR